MPMWISMELWEKADQTRQRAFAKEEVTQPALYTRLLCLSCSLLLAREVEPSRACIQRHHALTTVKSWRDRQPDYPAKK